MAPTVYGTACAMNEEQQRFKQTNARYVPISVAGKLSEEKPSSIMRKAVLAPQAVSASGK